MKKILVLFLSLALVFAFAACGGDTAAPEEDAAADTEVTEEVAIDGLEEGMTGTGEKEFDTELFTLTVPQDIQYELYCYSLDADTCTGSIQLDMGNYSTLETRLEVTTTRMVTSLDEAFDECVATKNLDTYENGSYEDLGSITVNGIEYRSVKIINEYTETVCLVSYYQRASDSADVYVEIQLDGVTPDEAYVQAILNSFSLK